MLRQGDGCKSSFYRTTHQEEPRTAHPQTIPALAAPESFLAVPFAYGKTAVASDVTVGDLIACMTVSNLSTCDT